MSTLTVRKKERFAVVPDRILEEKRLSLQSRAVAAWLHGRQDGFQIRVEVMRAVFLGISEKTWKTVRKELEGIGWWRSIKEKNGPGGTFRWSHEFCAEDEGRPANASSPSIPPSGRDGGGMDASRGDNHKDVYHQDVTKTTSKRARRENSLPVSVVVFSDGSTHEGIPTSLVDAIKFLVSKAKKIDGGMAAYAAGILKKTTQDALLAQYQSARSKIEADKLKAAETAEAVAAANAAAAEKAARGRTAPPANSELGRKLARARGRAPADGAHT